MFENYAHPCYNKNEVQGDLQWVKKRKKRFSHTLRRTIGDSSRYIYLLIRNYVRKQIDLSRIKGLSFLTQLICSNNIDKNLNFIFYITPFTNLEKN